MYQIYPNARTTVAVRAAIDRASRMVHLAVKDEETEAAATAFLKEAVAAFPFAITHVLTDRGSCFTADGFEATCRALGVQHRKTKPTRHRPTVWSNASTAASGARCWSCASARTTPWSACSTATGLPTTPANSVSSRATRPTRSSASA